MYLELLGKYAVRLMKGVPNYKDPRTRKYGLLNITLPFRLSMIHSFAKLTQLRKMTEEMLDPGQYDGYQEFLGHMKTRLPFPLMVGVRFSRAKTAGFLASIQKQIREQDPDHPEPKKSNRWRIRQLSFAFLNENFCVLYVTEYQARKLFSPADLAAFMMNKVLEDFPSKLLRQIYAADGAQHLGWLEFLHDLHDMNVDYSSDSSYVGSDSPSELKAAKRFEMLQLEKITIEDDIAQVKKNPRSFEDAAARKKELYAELAAVADELYNYYDPDEHEQDRSSSESETDSYQAEMLSDGALAVLAAQENANDEYQDTNDY